MKVDKNTIVIIGSGLSGATLAERFANDGHEVVIIEKRNHVGGNVYDYVNEDGIRVSKYGAHIFHTSNEDVWSYVNKFCEWLPYEHRVLSKVNNKLVPVPVNIDTVNQLLDTDIKNEDEMKHWLELETVKYDKVENSKDSALARVGNRLYKLMFENYTRKQR